MSLLRVVVGREIDVRPSFHSPSSWRLLEILFDGSREMLDCSFPSLSLPFSTLTILKNVLFPIQRTGTLISPAPQFSTTSYAAQRYVVFPPASPQLPTDSHPSSSDPTHPLDILLHRADHRKSREVQRMEWERRAAGEYMVGGSFHFSCHTIARTVLS